MMGNWEGNWENWEGKEGEIEEIRGNTGVKTRNDAEGRIGNAGSFFSYESGCSFQI